MNGEIFIAVGDYVEGLDGRPMRTLSAAEEKELSRAFIAHMLWLRSTVKPLPSSVLQSVYGCIHIGVER